MKSKYHITFQETKALIEMVYQYPSLYDPAHCDHKDPQATENIWKTVATVMNNETMDGLAWKAKWRTLRDSYIRKRREIKAQRGVQGAKNVKKWRFYDDMSFLENFVQDISSESNVKESDAIPSKINSPNRSDDEDDSNLSQRNATPCSSSLPVASTSSLGPQQPPQKRPMRATDDVEMNKMLKLLVASQTKSREMMEKEIRGRTEIDAFFESCAFRVKKLPACLQSYIQLQIGQILFNAENFNLNLPPQPITPLPYASTMETVHQHSISEHEVRGAGPVVKSESDFVLYDS